MRHRFTAGLLATALGASLLAAGAPGAHASSKGRKNTALGLGAVAVYELLQGKTTTGILAGAGAAYAYKRYSDARKNERRYDRYYSRGRYDGSPYRSNSGDSGFQFPAGYPNSSSYGNGDYQYQRGGYTGSGDYQYQHGDYGSDGYQYQRGADYGDDGRYRSADYGSRYDSSGNYAPGSRHGRKRGGRGHSVPPGHWRHD